MNERAGHKSFDVLVVGGGIAGQEAALNMGDLGYTVLLVEKDLSLGGKMLQLSKVFPTLDCAACIATPKVSETTRHPNVTLFTNSEVRGITGDPGGSFAGTLVKHPRYIDEKACTGCQDCEEACPVVVRDQYQYDLVGRKAAYIPFSIASPRIASIDLDNCILCGACERVCPADAVDFTQEEEQIRITVKTVILATGFELFDPSGIERYNFESLRNVITSMQMERQLVPTRPYNNVLRPGDGKMPDNIAYVLCAGSRDETMGNPICSQICCMYSIKQAQLVLGALPMADVTIYYIDIRAFGKGFEEFYTQTSDMGVEFVKGKIAEIEGEDDGDLTLKYEDVESGEIREAEHDMVVLSVGVLANREPKGLFEDLSLELDDYGYVRQTDILSSPASTSIPGVFVAGTASAPMDIPDSISSAGAAAAEAAGYLAGRKME